MAADLWTLTTGGRTLAFAEWGQSDGYPVFFLHGAPGSRFARFFDDSVYVEVGARVITYDRAGYGGSDRQRGRHVVDCVADVAAVADHLAIDHFAVTGASAGGPHCLAVAAGLPDRVTKASCVVGVAPFETRGFDWFAGMDPANIRQFEWALAGEQVLARELEREAGQMLEQVTSDPSTFLADRQLSESDRANLAKPARAEVTRQAVTEAFRHGVLGYVDDFLCLVRPWGFDVSEIQLPTRIFYGLGDVLSPRQHGDWLAANVPGAEAIVSEQAGHMSDREELVERYRWLVTPS